MHKILAVIDMQNDFVDGSLGTPEAVKIVPAAAEKIRAFDGDIYVTFDTHYRNYSDTFEGKRLPVKHCIVGTPGFGLNPEILKALEGKDYTEIAKGAFGASELSEMIAKKYPNGDFEIELFGLCTDICVISNALLLRSAFPNVKISVDASASAGVTPESHAAALTVMKACQIDILGE